jgi:hypothetical protein
MAFLDVLHWFNTQAGRCQTDFQFLSVFCSRALRPAYCFSNRRRLSFFWGQPCFALFFQQPPPFVVVFCSRALRPAYCFSNRRRVSSDCSDCHQSRRNNVTYWFRINLDVPDSLQI